MRDWHADLAITAFGKITAVYGHINENGRFIRNWLAWKMAITDKMVKNSWLSVKIKPFLTRFYGQIIKNGHFVRNIALNLCLSRRCATLCMLNCSPPWTCLILPEKSRNHTIRRFRHGVVKPSKTGAFLRSDRCHTYRGSCPRGISPDFVYFQGYATMRGYGQNADFWNLPVKSVQKQPS